MRRVHAFVAGVVAALLLTAAGEVPLVLPAPGGAPARIDFARDPLLGFGRGGVAPGPFLDTLGRAVAAHPAVLAAIADGAAASGVRTQVRAGLFPQVEISLRGSRALARQFDGQSAVVDSLQPRGRTDAVLGAQQLLWDFGATGQRIAAASAQSRAAQAEVERAASETALRAVSAWFDVLAFQSQTDLIAASIARQSDILSDVTMRVTQGFGAGGDVARAEAVLAGTKVQSARLERLLAQARVRYHEAFGNDAPLRLVRATAPRSAALSLDTAQAMARKSPAVQAALQRSDAARRDWRAVKADGLPRLTAGLDATRYDVFAGSDFEVRGTIGLRHSLFAGGRQRGAVAEARARSSQARFAADRVTLDTERDAAIAFADVAALATSATMLEAAYTANRRARDSYVEQFRVSRGTLIELLRAEQDYAVAAANYLEGVVELDVARFALLARTGELLGVVGVAFGTSGP